MSYTVRFHVTQPQHHDRRPDEKKWNGKYVANNSERYIEFKAEAHFLDFPEEFIPKEFQDGIKNYTEKITFVCNEHGIIGAAFSAEVDGVLVSYDDNKMMAKGKDLQEIVAACSSFRNSRGNVEVYYSKVSALEAELRKIKKTLALGEK